MRLLYPNLDEAAETEGHLSELVNDAIFASESIAKAILGSNFERIVGSMELCAKAVRELQPSKIVDLGGACGLTCFKAAEETPKSRFVVADRSRNALNIGKAWVESLRLTNIQFVRLDFCDSDPVASLGDENDLALLEYVLNISPETEHPDEAAEEMRLAVVTASMILRHGGCLQVRFGDYSDTGLAGLVRAACRAGLALEDASICRVGCTFLFERGDIVDLNEDREESIAFELFGSSLRRFEEED
jgi:hypothetical protein